ncbi:hypothetical protein ACVW00_000644 [Marmoricola sp. URHA0025 HA25]
MEHGLGRWRRWCTANQSDGRKVLELLINQRDWTHRRVETVSFLDTGETRRRVSWDFTVPSRLAVRVGIDRVAVPLATLAKEPLRRVDVSDAAGAAVSVWGTEDNGRLAVQALGSVVSGLLGRELKSGEADLIAGVVFARSAAGAHGHLVQLRSLLASVADRDATAAALALAEDLAANFLFVVELPKEVIERRSLVKLTYERPLDGSSNLLSTKHETVIKGGSWTTSTRSWHLEVQAPPGLAVSQLMFAAWDADEKVIDQGTSDSQGHTGHITGKATGHETDVEATLELLPAREGLINQVVAGAFVAFLLLVAGVIFSEEVFKATRDPNQAGSVAAVTLAIPAFLIALLARSREHPLVSRLLLAPRVNSVITALLLLSTAAALVFELPLCQLRWTLMALGLLQAMTLTWAIVIRHKSVGASG